MLISFELTIGEMRGMMNLCIPYNSIERISSKLSANSWIAYGRQQSSPESIARVAKALKSSLVELNVQLARTRITTGELIGLRVGDLITTQHDIRVPLVAMVEGVPKFYVRPGACKGHKAICVEEMLDEPPATAGG